MPEMGTTQWIIVLTLIVLAAVIIYGVSTRRNKPEASGGEIDEAGKNPVSEESIAVNEVVEQPKLKDETEVVAAIMAAICSYTNLSSDEFRIKSIKRVSESGSNWRKAGII